MDAYESYTNGKICPSCKTEKTHNHFWVDAKKIKICDSCFKLRTIAYEKLYQEVTEINSQDSIIYDDSAVKEYANLER
jgi:hypothetical protein